MVYLTLEGSSLNYSSITISKCQNLQEYNEKLNLVCTKEIMPILPSIGYSKYNKLVIESKKCITKRIYILCHTPKSQKTTKII